MRKANFTDMKEFIRNQNYNIRLNKNGRWIDQKCTPDVICIIADFILEFLSEEDRSLDHKFTSKDIWVSNKANKIVTGIFKKPELSEKSAKNEYDKLFGQPLKMFSAAGLLEEYPRSGPHGAHLYKVLEPEILRFISFREKNALEFINEYVKKTLIDSKLYSKFNVFFKEQTNESLLELKKYFKNFLYKYTNIKGEYEPNRILPKILNPLAFIKNVKGIERGYVSHNIVTYDMLMYNRDNFRDIYTEKPKNMTREEYLKSEKIVINDDLVEYQLEKAKKTIKHYNLKYRNGRTEHLEDDELDNSATQVHHIFPVHSYKSISNYIENLIMLTPNQHYLKAHPNNNTRIIDEQYQHLLLLSKTERIHENIKTDNIIYSVDDFKHVLSIGLENEDIKRMDSDYMEIIDVINNYYNY